MDKTKGISRARFLAAAAAVTVTAASRPAAAGGHHGLRHRGVVYTARVPSGQRPSAQGGLPRHRPRVPQTSRRSTTTTASTAATPAHTANTTQEPPTVVGYLRAIVKGWVPYPTSTSRTQALKGRAFLTHAVQ